MSEFNEPRWVRVVALCPVLALAAFGAAGLLLADLGLYRGPIVLVLGLAALIGLFVLARPLLRPAGDTTISSKVAAALAVVVSVASAVWNGANASEHVLINRDGGVYLNGGKWIATHGTLNLQSLVGAFSSNPAVTDLSIDMKDYGSHLEFSQPHLLSAMLANAYSLGGSRLMFLTAPMLGGLALLAFYLLAVRVLRQPFAALGAVVCLALVMPQVSFSRDTTTEIPIQVLLFTGLWLLCDRRALQGRGTAFCLGFLLGLIQVLHVDGLAFLVGLPLVYATLWVHAKGRERRRLRNGIIWSVLGICAALPLSALDLLRWSHFYLSHLRGPIEHLVAVAVLAIVAAFAAVAIARRANLFSAIQRARRSTAGVVGALVLVVGFGAWLLRPHLQEIHGKSNSLVGYLQRINHLPIDPTRKYFELSLRWISWYIGPITLTLAIVGAAALAFALVRGGVGLPTQIATLMLGPPSLLYIWRPTISADQIWAMRRFLPAAFPALILLAFGVLCAIARAPKVEYRVARRVVAIVLAVAIVAFPIYTIRNVSRMTEQRGLVRVVTAACKMLGPKSAVVLLDQTAVTIDYLTLPQTLRSFCNVPVAVTRIKFSNADYLRKLSSAWKADGRRLFIVAESPQTIWRVFPQARLRVTPIARNPHLLEITLLHRPNHYTSESLQLTAALVPTLPAEPSGAAS